MVKEIPQNNFSMVLAEAMRAKGISAEKLARETGISERFLFLMLEEQPEKLPASPYLHGYIIKIADVLGMDGEKVWNTYFRNSRYLKSSGVSDRLPKNRFAASRVNKKVLVVSLVIILIAAYFIIRALSGFDLSRELSLQNFDENTIVSQKETYTLRGNINPALRLMINDAPVYPGESGDFEKVLELEPGFNTVTFRVEGLLNKKEEIVKQIYFQDKTASGLESSATTTPPVSEEQ